MEHYTAAQGHWIGDVVNSTQSVSLDTAGCLIGVGGKSSSQMCLRTALNFPFSIFLSASNCLVLPLSIFLNSLPSNVPQTFFPSCSLDLVIYSYLQIVSQNAISSCCWRSVEEKRGFL